MSDPVRMLMVKHEDNLIHIYIEEPGPDAYRGLVLSMQPSEFAKLVTAVEASGSLEPLKSCKIDQLKAALGTLTKGGTPRL